VLIPWIIVSELIYRKDWRLEFVSQKQDRLCKYNVTLWRVLVTTVEWNAEMDFVCTVQLYVTVNNIKYWMSHEMFLWWIFISGNKSLHDKCPIFCPILTKFGVSQGNFIEVTSTKFHGNPSTWSLDGTRKHWTRCSIVIVFPKPW
jgi:hypothetical protein